MKNNSQIVLGMLLVASVATATQAEESAPKASAVVTTSAGKVQGLMDRGISAYKGIRYAAPPVAELRFMPPQPPKSWSHIEDATALGAPCMQMYSPGGPRQSDFSIEMQAVFPTGPETRQDNEDCLFLNVWTPAADGKKRPVLFWIHGGGHAYGSGGWPAYDGRNLAEKGDVVVITVNHRLNAFGYMALGDRFPEFKSVANVGDLDLVAALKWVQANAVAFGGDPGNVTIMGESGGGAKVSHLLAMPSAAGLFHKAVIQSGPGVTSGKQTANAALAAKVLDRIGVKTLADLRAADPHALVEATRTEMNAGGGYRMGGPNFGPVVDGAVLPRDPFAPTAPEVSRMVPIMIGWNKDEMTIFNAAQPWFGAIDFAALDKMAPMFGPGAADLIALYRKEHPDYSASHIANLAMGARFVQGTYILADRKAEQKGAPVFVYRLTYETKVQGGLYKTPHTLDIPFMFNNVDKARVLVGPGSDPEKLAAMMSDAWLAFARTGKPSSPLLPAWPAYDTKTRRVMQFDVTPNVADDPEKGARELLSRKP